MEMDQNSILIAVLVVIISIVLYFFFVIRGKSKGRGILLLGLSESGKTLVFSQLICEKYSDTCTSMKENVSVYDPNKCNLQLVDIPGQERVRGRIFDLYKSSARGVVYVVDSVTIQTQLRDAAEFLYVILSDEVIRSNQPEILILCNKQDETLSKKAGGIRTMLEKELNIVRDTKASQRRLAGEDKNVEPLGDPSKPFSFDDLSVNVAFAEGSAVITGEDEEPDLEELEDWLSQLD